MSKKKNTLKDLDEFLKQQAATLVSPSRLSDQVDQAAPVQTSESSIEQKQDDSSQKTISSKSIINDLKQLAAIKGESFKDEFCSIILAVMEGQQEYSPEDKMLINTALYLQHGSNWKEAIRSYWKNKNS
ncbi:MAG TPA: hypothetical protein VGD40_25795 [Chryseosolibacter sp.]